MVGAEGGTRTVVVVVQEGEWLSRRKPRRQMTDGDGQRIEPPLERSH